MSSAEVLRAQKIDEVMRSTAEQLRLLSKYSFLWKEPARKHQQNETKRENGQDQNSLPRTEGVVVLSDSDDDKPLSKRIPEGQTKPSKDQQKDRVREVPGQKMAAQADNVSTQEHRASNENEGASRDDSPNSPGVREIPGESSKEPGTGVRGPFSQHQDVNGHQKMEATEEKETKRVRINSHATFKRSPLAPRQTRLPNLSTARKPTSLEELRKSNPKLATNLDQAIERERQKAKSSSPLNNNQNVPVNSSIPRNDPPQRPQPQVQGRRGVKPNWEAAQNVLRTNLFGDGKAPASAKTTEPDAKKPVRQRKLDLLPKRPVKTSKVPTSQNRPETQNASTFSGLNSQLGILQARLRQESVAAKARSNIQEQGINPSHDSTKNTEQVAQPSVRYEKDSGQEHMQNLETDFDKPITNKESDPKGQPGGQNLSKQSSIPMEEEGEQNSEAGMDIEKVNEEWPQSKTRSEADKLEWERRAAEVQKQRLEAQRLKKRKRAEAEVEERALARLEEHRNLQVAKLQADQDKEVMRASIRDQLKVMILGKKELHQILLALGIQVQGTTPALVKKSYKLALQRYHPDRHVNASLREQLFAEELFKIISQAGQKLP